MNNEIVIVYQDCYLCGARREWGEKTINAITKAGVPYRKLSFASVEGQAHCEKAVLNGVTALPFVTDGKIYARDVEELLQAQSGAKKTKKVAKKTTKNKKGVKNGADSES